MASTDETADPRVERDRDGARRLEPAESDALFDRVWADTQAPGPVGSRLASRSTGVRRALAVTCLLGMGAALFAVEGPRPDLRASLPVLGPLGFAMVGLAVAGVVRALRPMHRPPPVAPWVGGPVLVAAALAVSLGGVLPGMLEPPAPAWLVHLHCWLATWAGGLGVGVFVWMLDRATNTAPWRLATAGAAAGLAAFAFQNLACPLVEPVHLVASHASATLGCALFLLAVARARGR